MQRDISSPINRHLKTHLFRTPKSVRHQAPLYPRTLSVLYKCWFKLFSFSFTIRKRRCSFLGLHNHIQRSCLEKSCYGLCQVSEVECLLAVVVSPGALTVHCHDYSNQIVPLCVGNISPSSVCRLVKFWQ